MTINRTTLLDLPLPVTGTESGVWGDVVNNGLSQYIDISVAGSLSLSADSDTNLSSTEGDASATNIGSTTAQYAILRCTGARTATRNINAPAWAISGGTLTNYSKIYIVVNETTGSQNIVLRATNSATPTYTTGVTIVPGERAVCAWNGSDFVKVGGAAGGSTTQIQFNNAGVFGGSANLTWDGTNVQIGATGALRLADTDSSNYVAFKSPGTVASNVTWTLPSADGSANQAIVTNGSGTLSFASVSTAAATPTTLGTVYGSMTTSGASPYLTALGYNAASINTGVNNTTVGFESLYNQTSGTNNTALGHQAMRGGGAGITGGSNVGIGQLSLGSITSGANNTAVGYQAGYGNTTANNSTAVGYQALYGSNTNGSNTAVGAVALTTNTTGTQNVAVGGAALQLNTTGSYNVAMGLFAGYSNTTGSNNVAIGQEALYGNTTVSSNTAVGFGSQRYASTGANAGSNTSLGYQAMRGAAAGLTGGNNVAIGYNAMVNVTSGLYNVAVGGSANGANTLNALSTGSRNVAIGAGSQEEVSTGVDNVGVGYQSVAKITTGSYNIGVGTNAAKGTYPATGDSNVAVGTSALTSFTTGYSNTGIGDSALRTTSTGAGNTAVGSGAMYSNTTASINAAVGFNALYANTTGASNVAFGCDTARKNTTGSYNTAIGQAALYENTTADANTAIGYQALYSNTTGTNNAAIGYQAGYSCTTGVRNTFLGTAAGNGGFGAGAFTSGQYNISIGFTTGASSGIINNSIVIGTPYAVVDKGENTGFITPNGGGVYQGNNSSSWSTTSDQRLKKNIVDNTEGLDKITQIRVRNFEYRTADEVTELPSHAVIKKEGVQLGVIAQELQQVCPDCVKEESTGVLSVDSDNVFWHMLNAIKELNTRLQAAEAEIATLKGA